MKNAIKLFGVIALAAVIGFTFAACDNGTGGPPPHTHSYGDWLSNATQHWKVCSCGDEYGREAHNGSPCSVCGYTGSTPTPSYSLEGLWTSSSGVAQITVSGSTGTRTRLGTSALTQSAVNKGYISLGQVAWRNLRSIDAVTWSGEILGVWFNTSAPDVATGAAWQDTTFTLSNNGETLTTYTPGFETTTSTWTKGSGGTPPPPPPGGDPNASWDKLHFGTGATSSDTANNVRAVNTSITGAVVIPSLNRNGTTRITTINSKGFSGCVGVTSVTLPETLTAIYSEAFSGCTGITSIDIPSAVTSIQSNAFFGCENLTSVTFHSDSISITAANSFPGDLRLKYMTGGAGTYTRTAGSDTWATPGGSILDILTPSGTSGNVSVKAANSSISGNIVIPEYIGSARVTSIAGSGFSGCTEITGVTLPTSITAINGSAFLGCTGITSITIPATVTSIQSNAFSGCENLTTVTFSGSSTSISAANSFIGDLRAVYTGAGGGAGTYRRTGTGASATWTK